MPLLIRGKGEGWTSSSFGEQKEGGRGKKGEVKETCSTPFPKKREEMDKVSIFCQRWKRKTYHLLNRHVDEREERGRVVEYAYLSPSYSRIKGKKRRSVPYFCYQGR